MLTEHFYDYLEFFVSLGLVSGVLCMGHVSLFLHVSCNFVLVSEHVKKKGTSSNLYILDL